MFSAPAFGKFLYRCRGKTLLSTCALPLTSAGKVLFTYYTFCGGGGFKLPPPYLWASACAAHLISMKLMNMLFTRTATRITDKENSCHPNSSLSGSFWYHAVIFYSTLTYRTGRVWGAIFSFKVTRQNLFTISQIFLATFAAVTSATQCISIFFISTYDGSLKIWSSPPFFCKCEHREWGENAGQDIPARVGCTFSLTLALSPPFSPATEVVENRNFSLTHHPQVLHFSQCIPIYSQDIVGHTSAIVPLTANS